MAQGERPAEEPNAEGGEQPPDQAHQPREDSASAAHGVDDWRAQSEGAAMEQATGQGGVDPAPHTESHPGPANTEGTLVQAPTGGKFGSEESATDAEAEQLQSFGARAKSEMQRET